MHFSRRFLFRTVMMRIKSLTHMNRSTLLILVLVFVIIYQLIHKGENRVIHLSVPKQELSHPITSLRKNGSDSANFHHEDVDTLKNNEDRMASSKVLNEIYTANTINQSRRNTYDNDDIDIDITSFDDHIILRPNNDARTTSQKTTDVSQVSSNGVFKDWRLNVTDEYESDGYRLHVYNTFYRPIMQQKYINCSAIVLDGNKYEIRKAKNMSRRALEIQNNVHNLKCEHFKVGRGYIMHPLSKKELDFPLAFSIIVYRDPEQVERLLRSIYRPHNYYCLHVDMKTSPTDSKMFETIANCFENVVIANKSVNVTWGGFSVLEAELICMRELLQHKAWKYFINLTGQEFPLKTNRELVAILESFEGANIVDGTWIRARERYFYRWTKAKIPPPHRIRPIKGSVHVAVNRQFVDFAINDQRSKDFTKWLEKTDIPDETFFASLNHNPHLGINGSFLGDPEEYPLKPSLTRYKNWQPGHATFTRSCEGKFVRHICVLGVGDVHRAYTDIGLFANKFHLDFEPLALDCLEEVLYEKTWVQYINNEDIDTSYYSLLDYNKKKLFIPSTLTKKK